MRRWIIGLLLASAASQAQASDKPRYEAAPAWVKPAPAIDGAALKADSPVLLTLDRQQRLENGTVANYTDIATRMASPEVVGQAGTLRMTWQPARGDLVVHRVEIIRGVRHIDVLAQGKRFEVIRREEQLDQRALNGELTATMAVEGLQVGDVLRVAATVTSTEPALHGGMQAAGVLPVGEANPGFERVRMLWPAGAPVMWRSYAEGGKPIETTTAGEHEVVLAGPLPKPADLPGDAPLRFRKLPLIEASTFKNWPAVSATMAPLYATEGTIAPGGPLAAEVARIAAARSDPLERAAAALELVQEKVRYLYNGMENGNYMPQSPAQTWTLRYGDCKAKTLLLLAMLRELGITAEPVLANASLGDLLPQRLPSAGAFDHVLVRAEIAGESFWLEGTATGARYSNIRDTPPFRWVLPVRTQGAALLAVPARAPAQPSAAIVLDLDQRAGINLPTLVHMTVTLRGASAESVGLAKAQGTKEQKDQAVQGLMAKLLDRSVAVSGYTLAYDPVAAEATITATGVAGGLWRKRDGHYRVVLDKAVSRLAFEPDRGRAAWTAMPVATGAPDAVAVTTRLHLPADLSGFMLDGDATLSVTLAGSVIRRTARLEHGTVIADEQAAATGAEIAAADVPAERARVALAKKRLFEVVAPAALPPRWQDAAQGRRDGRYQPLLAAYAQAIADDPKEAANYSNRANFLLGTYDWRGALPDLDKAIALEPSVALYLQRAGVHRVLHDDAAMLADVQAARTLDPADTGPVGMLATYDVDHDQREAGLALLQERIDAGGENKVSMIEAKAELLARAGDGKAALALIDDAMTGRPGNAGLLNTRCWVKGLLDTALDTALKDCTHAIELSETSYAALDSRALIYFRLKRYDDALADIAAVLEQQPEEASSLFLRGVIRNRTGQAAAAKIDLAAAATLQPLIADERKRFGIVP
jgi:tetratricopeptide (TPR) repeat protein